MRRMTGVLILIVAAFGPAALAQRSLSWSSVDVDARLEADGSLRIRERQAYVFDGEWNGGERLFRVEPGQELEFHSMARIDPATGAEIPLSSGSLSLVDEYQFVTPKTLRWRSRLADDPPFSDAKITYVLDYTLRNILVRRGNGYLLDHEFLFSDRSWPIERFTLDLVIDEAWRAPERTVHREITNVPKGERALIRMPLEYVAAGAPAARPDRRPRVAAQLALVAVMALISWLVFAGREKRLGRFDPLPEVDRAWIETYLLPIRAEVVGAAWDESVSESEVAAMLARLVAEKKIETTTVKTEAEPELHMELKVAREELSGYERELIDQLFFSGNTTSTEAIQAHYASSGFNPASVIKPAVTKEVDALLGGPGGSSGAAGCVLWVVALAPIVLAVVVMPAERKGVAVVAGIVFAVLHIVGGIGSGYWNSRLDCGRKEALWNLLTPWALMALVLVGLALFEVPLPVELLFTAAVVSAIASSVGLAASKRSREAMSFRRKLTAVRHYFESELALERPRLDDSWFPYVLAFGLSKEAEKWFQAFGGTTASSARSFGRSTSTSSSSSSGSGGGWTGGGGAFGGAGASGTWVAAAGGMASGVASPSSGGSGGGGGGGGGSSGGGGGGGW